VAACEPALPKQGTWQELEHYSEREGGREGETYTHRDQNHQIFVRHLIAA
jgi:hypothetical protein